MKPCGPIAACAALLAISALVALPGCGQAGHGAGCRPPTAAPTSPAAAVHTPSPAAHDSAAEGGADAASPAADSGQPARTATASESPLKLLDNFHPIVPGRAYRGAQVHDETLAYIVRHHGVRTVVNLRGENSGVPWYDWEKAECGRLGVQLIDIRTSAAALPPPEELLALYDTIQSAPEPLLFHCKSGADRTGMASALWRMLKLGEDVEAAGNQLSIAFGHFRGVHPEMMELVRLFQADRDWIVNEYPHIYAERTAARKPGGGADD